MTKRLSKFRLWAAITMIVIGGLLLLPPSQAQEQAGQPVLVMTMDGAIGPAFHGYLDSGIRKASDLDAQLILIELSTPGGLLTSTRDMVSSILRSPVPVAVWVTPSGSHAASAGTFILYAAHIAAMDSSTNVGAATPVELGGMGPGADEDDDDSESRRAPSGDKAMEDTAAFIRGLAELRGRNAEWAERAVREASSLTAEEALRENVIDFIATSREDFLSQADGRTVSLRTGESSPLALADVPVIEFRPDWKVRILSFITDPNIAFILMSIGVYGLILEFYNPGALIPGSIGAISLILALYALNILPINAAGVILLIIGLLFIIAEAFMPSFGILGLAGLTAFVIGATIMFDTDAMPGLGLDWGVIWGVTLLGLIMVGLIVYLTVKVYRQKISTGVESMIGHTASVVEWQGRKGRVRIQGEIWQAESDELMELSKDEDVLISAVKDLHLKVRPVDI